MIENPLLSEKEKEDLEKQEDSMDSSNKSDSDDNDNNSSFSMDSIADVLRNIWRVLLNFFVLYIFKYVSISGIADRSTMKLSNSEIFLERNAYMLIQVFYNFGIFFGKSSLFCFETKKIDILTWAIAIVTSIFAFLTVNGISIPILSFNLIFMIGWISGVSKSQGYNLIQENRGIKPENREVALVLASVLADTSIIISYSASILVSVYLMPYE